MYFLFCVVPCTVCVYMCTELLPPGDYLIAVKYIISYYIKRIRDESEFCAFDPGFHLVLSLF
jgi:hypothetical protein